MTKFCDGQRTGHHQPARTPGARLDIIILPVGGGGGGEEIKILNRQNSESVKLFRHVIKHLLFFSLSFFKNILQNQRTQSSEKRILRIVIL